jgi:hypothetical protein
MKDLCVGKCSKVKGLGVREELSEHEAPTQPLGL